jgi:hypothetical protein
METTDQQANAPEMTLEQLATEHTEADMMAVFRALRAESNDSLRRIRRALCPGCSIPFNYKGEDPGVVARLAAGHILACWELRRRSRAIGDQSLPPDKRLVAALAARETRKE